MIDAHDLIPPESRLRGREWRRCVGQWTHRRTGKIRNVAQSNPIQGWIQSTSNSDVAWWHSGVTVSTLDLRSKGRGFDTRSGRYFRMGDCLRTGKPSRYKTNTKVNSAFRPSGVCKSIINIHAWRVHLWRMAHAWSHNHGRWRSVSLKYVVKDRYLTKCLRVRKVAQDAPRHTMECWWRHDRQCRLTVGSGRPHSVRIHLLTSTKLSVSL